MRVNSVQHFLKRIASRAHCLKPWRASGFAHARQASPHLRWSLAMTGRFLRHSDWSRPSQEMSLRLRSPFWMVLRRDTGKQSISPALVLPQMRTPVEKRADRSSAAPAWNSQAVTSSPAKLEAARNPSLTLLLSVHNRLHTLTTATFSRHVLTQERTVQSLVREPLRTGNGFKPSAFDSFSVHRTLAAKQPQPTALAYELDAPFPQTQLRHRRLEQAPFLKVSETAHPVVPEHISYKPDVVRKFQPRPPARVIADEPAVEPRTRSRNVRPEPPVNIGQITDAVLQQLDHRLLAARERMGRI